MVDQDIAGEPGRDESSDGAEGSQRRADPVGCTGVVRYRNPLPKDRHEAEGAIARWVGTTRYEGLVSRGLPRPWSEHAPCAQESSSRQRDQDATLSQPVL